MALKQVLRNKPTTLTREIIMPIQNISQSFKVVAASALILGLSACATSAPQNNVLDVQNQLFSGIESSKYDGSSLKARSAEDPICLQFYANGTQYVTQNTASGGTSFAKTLALAGAASGGIASIGIGSAFLETAIAGTANQVVYQGGQKVLDNNQNAKPDPIADVNARAGALGCPPMSMATIKASKEAAKALKKKDKES
jgi:hypothetical protein